MVFSLRGMIGVVASSVSNRAPKAQKQPWCLRSHFTDVVMPEMIQMIQNIETGAHFFNNRRLFTSTLRDVSVYFEPL